MAAISAAVEDKLRGEEEEKQRTNLVKFEENGSIFTRVQKSCSGSKYVISMGLTETASSSSPPPQPCSSSSSSSSPSSIELSSFDEDMSADDVEAGPSTEQEARAASFQRPFEDDMYMEPPRWSRLIQQSKLRPKKRKEEKGQEEEGGNFFPEENGIVQMNKLTELFRSFSEHFKSKCSSPNPIVSFSERKGLCFSLFCKCSTCGYESNSVKMYQECKIGTRGPASGDINEGLMLAVTKTKVGPTDLACILACMNIRPMSLSNMYKKLNRVCDKMTTLNQTSMIKNQEFVRDLQETVGCSSKVAVETDTSFNNRIQAGYEAGTVSFSPMLEQTTGFHLPVSAVIYSKICKVPNCTHTTAACTRNFSTEESMSSSERKALIQNLENVRNSNVIEISSVTTDASAQAEKVIDEYRSGSNDTKLEHDLCFVHRMRTLQKNLKKVKLVNIPVIAKDRDAYMQKLSYCIRIRANLELTKVRNLFGERQFVVRAGRALRNILSCFSGDHAHCNTRSPACTAHLPTYTTSHLPLEQHLALCDEDRQTLQAEICRTLNPAILGKLRTLRTTNRSESMHRRAFTYAPKNTVWSRNFPALCHSALHSSSYGTGRSAVKLSEMMNIHRSLDSPFCSIMGKRDARAVYDLKRTSTLEFKRKRFNARKQKCNKRIQQKQQQ